METVTLKKEINWQKILGFAPKIKNRKVIIFSDDSEKEESLTRIVKVKLGNQEYIMNHYVSEETEEINIKNNRALLLLELEYNKKTNDLKKKVNYDFTEIITYFLLNFFGERLKEDQEFQAIKECLKENEIISLEISECSI